MRYTFQRLGRAWAMLRRHVSCTAQRALLARLAWGARPGPGASPSPAFDAAARLDVADDRQGVVFCHPLQSCVMAFLRGRSQARLHTSLPIRQGAEPQRSDGGRIARHVAALMDDHGAQLEQLAGRCRAGDRASSMSVMPLLAPGDGGLKKRTFR
jgi:hypothetical protein